MAYFPHCDQTTRFDRQTGGPLMWVLPVDATANYEHRAVCLRIVQPWYRRDEYLVVRATRGDGNDGGEIVLSIWEESPYWPFVRKLNSLDFDVTQRNPNRHADGDDVA